MPVLFSVSYHGSQLVEAESENVTDPLEALKAAKQKAHLPAMSSRTTQRITTSRVVINDAHGRNTREFELQWWPAVYNGSNYGKLTLRFYVAKVLV